MKSSQSDVVKPENQEQLHTFQEFLTAFVE